MKQVLIGLLALAALGAGAQQQKAAAPSGTPALLEAANGKKFVVYLQRLEDGKLTFQASGKEMAVPADKITSLKFSMTKEEFDFVREQNLVTDEQISEIYKMEDVAKSKKLELIFKAALGNIAESHNQGDQSAVIDALDPFMRERAQYMPVKNNLQDAYIMMMVAYRSEGNYAKVRECASILLESADPAMVAKGQANLALAALDEGDVPAAEKLRDEIVSEAAKLYLLACMQRVQNEPKQAIQTVTGIIADHANDVEWLAPSELLSAHLYLDMAMTNSAVNTARQVMNMYAGTYVSGDAARFYNQLGGEGETTQ